MGSRTLAKRSGLDLSAATVRNVMADLEEAGYLAAPHTSAGRIPTALGYRFFVDSLIKVQPLDPEELERLEGDIPQQAATQDMLASVSGVLSDVTKFAGLVSVPKRDQISFRHVDFVPLADQRVLVIIVFSDGEVQNRIVQTRRPFSAGELQQAANYLNRNYVGVHLTEIRGRLKREMAEARDEMNRIMAAAMELADPGTEAEDLLVTGQNRLMDYEELADMRKLRQLFDAFQEKRGILHLLDRTSNAEGVRIFIGEESGFSALGACSVVTAPYKADGQVLGVLGVIGPTRMQYERVIPVVDATARLLSSLLQRGL